MTSRQFVSAGLFKDPYDCLAAAIIEQAVMDYRRKNSSITTVRGCVKFFGSAWFRYLADCIRVEPGYVLRKTMRDGKSLLEEMEG